MALERKTGKVLWRLVSPPGSKEGSSGYAGSLAVEGDKVIAAGFDGILLALPAK